MGMVSREAVWFGNEGYKRSPGIMLDFRGRFHVLDSEAAYLMMSLPNADGHPSAAPSPRILKSSEPEQPHLGIERSQFEQGWDVTRKIVARLLALAFPPARVDCTVIPAARRVLC